MTDHIDEESPHQQPTDDNTTTSELNSGYITGRSSWQGRACASQAGQRPLEAQLQLFAQEMDISKERKCLTVTSLSVGALFCAVRCSSV